MHPQLSLILIGTAEGLLDASPCLLKLYCCAILYILGYSYEGTAEGLLSASPG